MNEEKTCKQCGTRFKPKRNTSGKFCSKKCVWDYQGKDKGRAPLCKLGY